VAGAVGEFQAIVWRRGRQIALLVARMEARQASRL
jgi:hypothetical protein